MKVAPFPRVGASRLASEAETAGAPTPRDATALTEPVGVAPVRGSEEIEVDVGLTDTEGRADSDADGTEADETEADDATADEIDADEPEADDTDATAAADEIDEVDDAEADAMSAGATKTPPTPRVREVRSTAVTSTSKSGVPLCSLHDGTNRQRAESFVPHIRGEPCGRAGNEQYVTRRPYASAARTVGSAFWLEPSSLWSTVSPSPRS